MQFSDLKIRIEQAENLEQLRSIVDQVDAMAFADKPQLTMTDEDWVEFNKLIFSKTSE